MNIHVEDTRCCQCQTSVMETKIHFFVNCEYSTRVRADLQQRAKINLTSRDLKHALEKIKAEHWKKFKKEVVATIWEPWHITFGKQGTGSNLKVYRHSGENHMRYCREKKII